MGSLSKQWCKHYHGMSGQEQCGAGVRFDSLTNYGTRQFHESCPCFGLNGITCEKAEYPTVAEMVERERAMLAVDGIGVGSMSEPNEASMSSPVHAIIAPQLDWDYGDEIRLDNSIVFGLGYDFFGLESLRREANGPNGNYLMWPNSGKWSLYRDTDGMLAFEKYASREECEQAAERWCSEVL